MPDFKLREINEGDAESFLTLCKQLDQETSFMLLEADERVTTASEQQEKLRAVARKDNQTIIVAELDGKLVGYVAGLGGEYRRNWHKAEVVIGILQDCTGQRLGTKLLEELENWAREKNLHKLELTVMAHNERAIKLYKKMGFQVEGVSVDSLFVDGRYVDELDMAKILDRDG